MADFSNIIQEINDDITTNGVGAITGAKLNEVLRDMIAAVNAEKQDPLTIDATPTEDSTNPVQSGGVFTALNALAVSENCLFGGFVEPNDEPTYGDDHRYYYLAATEDRYTHFNNYEVDSYIVMFSWNENTQNWRMLTLWPNDQTVSEWLQGKANIVNNATDGNLAGLNSYGDLTDSGIAASDVATTSDLAGKQDTISDLATIRSGAAAGATAVQPSDLAAVASSGSYNDLLNKPTIPAAQVNADWNANSGVAQILNKPTIPAAQVQSDWDEADNTKVDYIKNKPTIPNVSGKADKVVGATSGDVATLDGTGNLTSSGLSVFDFFVMVEDASTPPASMAPNNVYQYGTLAGNTTFPPLATPTEPDIANVYCWTFTTPAAAPTITWPSAITSWAGGSAPTINASKSYEVSVMDGLATIIEN